MATPLENMAALLQKSEQLLAPQEEMDPPMRVLLACMVESQEAQLTFMCRFS